METVDTGGLNKFSLRAAGVTLRERVIISLVILERLRELSLFCSTQREAIWNGSSGKDASQKGWKRSEPP